MDDIIIWRIRLIFFLCRVKRDLRKVTFEACVLELLMRMDLGFLRILGAKQRLGFLGKCQGRLEFLLCAEILWCAN